MKPLIPPRNQLKLLIPIIRKIKILSFLDSLFSILIHKSKGRFEMYKKMIILKKIVPEVTIIDPYDHISILDG